MKRQLIASLAIALILAFPAGVVFAADDVTPPPLDASLLVVPTPTLDATPTLDPSNGGGELAIDPLFLTPTPAATPMSEVLGATGRPGVTPPPTDVEGGRTTTPGYGLAVLLLLGTALATLLLLAGRLPVARRR